MNIQSHILPASLAAALHAALFLGFPNTPAPSAGTVLVPQNPPHRPIPIEPPPTVQERDPTEEIPAPSPLKGAQPLEIPEPPVKLLQCDFPIEIKPAQSRPDPLAPLGPPGRPDGIDHGFENGQPPIFLTPADLDRTPRATAQIPPDYPAVLRQAGIGGEVVVEFAVDATGRVLSAHVLRSSHHEFEEPTLRAVLKWRFEPGKRNGQAVPFRMAVPVDFTVGGI